MYSCILSFTVLPGTCELSREIVHAEIVPMLRRREGLIDYVVLESADEPSEFVVNTFWESRPLAEECHRSMYARVIELLRPHLDGQAKVRFYTLDAVSRHEAAELAAEAAA